MSSTFNITEWVLKNTIKEGSKKTIYDFIEHVVENWPVSLNEKYGKDFFNTLKARFKGQVSGLGDSYGKISDEDIERYIELFDKNKDKGTFGNNKDINAYTLPELIQAVNRFDDQDAIKSVEQAATPADEVYKDEEKDIIIWYGHQDNCIRQGADQPIPGGTRWCITQPGGSYWGRYHYGKDYDYPTFYLIRNGQLPKGDKLSFIAVQVLGNGDEQNGMYKYTNRENRPGMSDPMSLGELMNEVPWLKEIPDLKNKLEYVGFTPEEKERIGYKPEKVKYTNWLKFKPKKQKDYLEYFGKDREPFTDLSMDSFLTQKLFKNPNIQNIADYVTKIFGIIDVNFLAKAGNQLPNEKEYEGYKKDIKRLWANKEGGQVRQKLNINVLEDPDVDFNIKKEVTNEDIWDTKPNEYVYMIGNSIIHLKIKSSDSAKMDSYNDRDIHLSNIDVFNKDNLKLVLNSPKVDEFPLPFIFNILKDNTSSGYDMNRILEKALKKPNSSIVVKDTDDGRIILDPKSFTSYKIENNRLLSIPFDSEEVQKALGGEESKTKFQKSAVDLVFGAKTLPDTIEKGPFLQILNNIPYNKRKGIAEDREGVILVNPNAEDQPIFVIDPVLSDGRPSAIIDYGRKTRDGWRTYDYRNSIGSQNWPTVIKYYRDTNQPFSDRQIKGLLMNVQNKNIAKLIVQANPLMAQDSTLKPVLANDDVILFNTRDPRSSFIVSDRTGKLLNKVISSIQAGPIRQRLGLAAPQAAAPAAGERRIGRPAGRAGVPRPAAAPVAGGLPTSELMANKDLETAFNSLPGSVRAKLTTAVQENGISRGASRRNNLLGARGRVTSTYNSGPSSIYFITLANRSTIASINTQPGNGHYILIPNREYVKLNSPTELLSALQARGLAENLAHAIVSEFLAQNPTMIDEAKNALRLILKNKKS